MRPPTFIHRWSANKMIRISDELISYWEGISNKHLAHLERLNPDERYLSLRKKLERAKAEADHNAYLARLFARDVIDCATDGQSHWEVKTDDFPWFFPQDAPIDE